MSTAAGNAKQFAAGKARRQKYLDARYEGREHMEALAIVGVTHAAYRQWRAKYKDFAAQVDSIATPFGPITANTKFMGGFSDFRRQFFRNESPWFQERIIQALEAGAPGSVTLITIPPEHGKTTTLEDYCNYKLAMEPTFRITVGSGSKDHSVKVLGRVKNRMEADGPFPKYVHRFGPFRAPEKNKRKAIQPWAAGHFDVFKKGNFDERDYSMGALGMTSNIVGTRTDLLLVDDPQSQKTLDQTEKMFATFRQDWLSRPGSKGRTVVLMTRQGEGDFAEALMESEILDHHIVLPAWSEEHGWLWPERYSEHEYEIMRRNAGEEAWERNYMQIARPKHSIIFARDAIAKGRDPQRSILNIETPETKPCSIGIGLDPGYGVCGLTAAVMGNKFEIVEARKIRNLTGTEAIIAELEDLVARCHLPGYSQVTDVVMESMAFQKGLLTDERVMAMQRQYGFFIHPHETGDNKYDRDFGVPQMVYSLLREEINWPWGDDISQHQLKELEDDMYRWRPGIKGSKLEQDVLMSTWFLWLLWRKRRRTLRHVDTSSFDFTPAPRLLHRPVRLATGAKR